MKHIVLAASVAAMAAPIANAETYQLTISSSHATSIPWVAPLQTVIVAETNQRLEAMGSENRVEWTEAYGGSLYGFTDTLEAVGEGITDMGWIGTLWEESKMPYQNLTYYTPFSTDDVTLLAKTFNALHRDLPFLQQSWEDQNVVFLGSTVADTYHLYTTFPVNSLEDLKGRKILAPGPSGAWIAAVGAIPVDGSLTTYYNQIETGVAEGALSIMTGVYPLKIHEVAPYVTISGVGANMIGAFGVNRDIWEDLPEDVRAVLTELGEEYSATNARVIEERYQSVVEKLSEDPKVTVTELSHEDRAKWAAALPDLAGNWAASQADGAALIAAYMAALKESGGTALRDWTIVK